MGIILLHFFIEYSRQLTSTGRGASQLDFSITQK